MTRLREEDRQAIIGRIELGLPYAELAPMLGNRPSPLHTWPSAGRCSDSRRRCHVAIPLTTATRCSPSPRPYPTVTRSTGHDVGRDGRGRRDDGRRDAAAVVEQNRPPAPGIARMGFAEAARHDWHGSFGVGPPCVRSRPRARGRAQGAAVAAGGRRARGSRWSARRGCWRASSIRTSSRSCGGAARATKSGCGWS